MPVNNITQTVSTLPPAGRRGVDVQTVFVIKQEDFQDHLQGTTVTELNTLKTQINTTVTGMNIAVETVNTKAGEASASASSASTSANTATTKASEASTSASNANVYSLKAGKWADNNYNVEVEAGKYSAKHWATEASNILANTVKLISTNITVNVGTGQTYTTINQALEYLSGFCSLYKTTGVTATINLKAGFVMNEQVLVRGLNLGWITIVGEDAETIITHTALTTDFTSADYGFPSYPAFGVSKGGTSPRIGQLFRFNVEKVGGEKHGLMTIGAGSSAEVLSGKGFIGAGTHGIVATNGSVIHASYANITSAGFYGIHAATSSTINAEGANASNAGNSGICAIGNSTIYAYDAIIQNQTTGSARVRVESGSHITAIGINTTGGTVPALSQTANTLTGNGIIYQ